jgi:iron-sulfur cluster assembly accessory protein
MSTPPFSLSARATDEVQRALGKIADRPAGAGLRIEIADGDCAGHRFRLAFDVPTDRDVVVQCDGVSAFIAAEDLPYVTGATVDFLEHEDAFAVTGAPVVAACGCGNSFQLAS